jgi:hypothetical protein
MFMNKYILKALNKTAGLILMAKYTYYLRLLEDPELNNDEAQKEALETKLNDLSVGMEVRGLEKPEHSLS